MKPLARISAAMVFCAAGAFSALAYPVRSYEGRFSVEFPSAPAFNVIQDVGSCQKTRNEYRYTAGKQVWMASFQDCKPSGMLADIGVNPTMRDWAKAVAKAVSGEVRGNDPITHGPLSGREFLVKAPGNLVLRGRVFIEGDRIYQLIYAGPVGTEDTAEIEAFFASFKVMR